MASLGSLGHVLTLPRIGFTLVSPLRGFFITLNPFWRPTRQAVFKSQSAFSGTLAQIHS